MVLVYFCRHSGKISIFGAIDLQQSDEKSQCNILINFQEILNVKNCSFDYLLHVIIIYKMFYVWLYVCTSLYVSVCVIKFHI